VGKTTIGRIFAKVALCDNTSEGEPCCSCESCKLFDSEKHFSYKELDAASFGGKDDMVKLRDDAAFQSVGKKKIILLDECHDISKQGQDALLKQVEQCPDHLIYIFCTTDPDKMNGTLRKRCMEFQISKVGVSPIEGLLKSVAIKEGLEFEEEAFTIIAREANGHVRDALNTLEETSYLGKITLENLRRVSKNYDEEVFSVISNLGSDLNASLVACRKISSSSSVWELYSMVINMLSDASKLIYGYEDFLPQRKELLIRLRDIHGYSILEFLDYLMRRDKYVDKVGLQSDIVLLHYKFCSESFKPQIKERQVQTVAVAVPETQIQNQKSESGPRSLSVSHAQLSKLDIKDRSRVLREQRMVQKPEQKEKEKEKVPITWPLPKEERSGENSFTDDELTPEEFSQNLVGGRARGNF